MANNERPPVKKEWDLWKKNDWDIVWAPQPNNPHRPAFSQSSKWLSMNLLSTSSKCMVIEEQERPMYDCLTDLGFDPIPVPFRHVFEFGGALHCATWDIKRKDECVDYFPN